MVTRGGDQGRESKHHGFWATCDSKCHTSTWLDHSAQRWSNSILDVCCEGVFS